MSAASTPTSSPTLGALLRRTIVSAAALATVLFGLPLAFAVGPLFRAEALDRLAGDAERARSVATDERLAAARAGRYELALPIPSDHSVSVGVYDAEGHRVAGHGPTTAEALTRHTLTSGVETDGEANGALVVAVPVIGDEAGPRYVVRASRPATGVQGQTYLAWAVMGVLAAGALGVAAAFGRARARAIARPLQSLAGAADRLGRGDFAVPAVPTGVAEVDAAGASLARTARRLGGLLERERAFTADASHQLRSPLTAVRVGLEAAMLDPDADLRGAIDEALSDLDRLEQTVLDLLELARDARRPGQPQDAGAVLAEEVRTWSRRLADAGRALRAEVPAGLPPVAVSAPALRTVLDVLLGNALEHGAGEVRLAARAAGGTVLITVSDAGPGIQGDPDVIFVRRSAEARGTGIGLSLARTLLEAEGGRLELTRAVPATFSVLLPPVPDRTPMAGRSDSRSPAP